MKPSKFEGHIVVGITGTIASGKSTVSRFLEETYHALRIDADLVGREAVEYMRETLAGIFGEEILFKDRTEAPFVNRKALGNIVFNDPEKLEMLNKTVHPEVCKRIGRMIENAKETVVIVEAIELLRSGLKDMIDAAWVVYAEPEIRAKRMMEERGLTFEEAMSRIASQLDDKTYRSMADTEVKSTDGPRELLTGQAEEKMNELLASFQTETSFHKQGEEDR